MDSEVLVEVSDVSRSYGHIQAVKALSFAIRRGEVLGLLGPNGAGKTTTMQIVSGTLAADSGTVRIAGHDLLEEPRTAKAALGYLPEQAPLYRELTVDEYLLYCAALSRVPRARRRAACELAKERCGLSEVGARLIGNLSKGFQQRVGLAQAIIHMPPVIILDEPTIGLDPIQIREVRDFVRELGKEHAVMLSTHVLPEVQASCDRVLILNNGALVLSDTLQGLARHMRSTTLLVGFRRRPHVSALQSLPGITAVQTEGANHLRVLHEPADDPGEAIARLAAQHDWGLYEMHPQHSSLEQIFLQLTTTEPKA